MCDNKSGRLSPELITNCINELAREVGAMEPDDPRWATVLDELSQLTQLRRAVRFASDPFCGQYMDELAREMSMLKPGDPRRTEIVEEIMRLSDSVKRF